MDRIYSLGQTQLMGILNVTPDSFSDGGRYFDSDAAVARALEIEREGAEIIDIGGESTRPGSARISEKEELSRVAPVLERLRGRLKIPFSIDTRSPLVAETALRLGASYVNHITVDGEWERASGIAELAVKFGAELIMTYARGPLETMHKLPPMRDVVQETYETLRAFRLLATGVGLPKERLFLDPGIGFGKDAKESYLLLRRLEFFRSLECRLVVGTSRKRFLSADPEADRPEDREYATAATVAILAMYGCEIVRVHNVRAMSQVVQVVRRYLSAGE